MSEKLFDIQKVREIEFDDKSSWYYRLGLHKMTDGEKMKHFFSLPCAGSTPAPIPTDGFLFMEGARRIYLMEMTHDLYVQVTAHRDLTESEARILIYAHRSAWDAGYFSSMRDMRDGLNIKLEECDIEL